MEIFLFKISLIQNLVKPYLNVVFVGKNLLVELALLKMGTQRAVGVNDKNIILEI